MSASEIRRDLLETVSNVDADERRLISVAVPPELSVEAARERVEETHTDAEQLERDETSEGTRKALETVRRVLSDYEETPANGLAVYAGVVGSDEVVYAFDDLAEPVPEFALERDNEFDTDLLDVAPDASRYGLLVVEHGTATLGTTAGEEVEPVATIQSDTAADTPTSGELGDREQGQREFFEEVARRAGVAFLDEDPDVDEREHATPGEPDIDPVEGLFVGGSSVTATEFLEQGYLDHRLRQRVLGDAFSVGEASEEGLEQLAAKAQDHLEAAEREAIEERLGDLFAELDADAAAVVGRENAEEALEYEAVETVLAVESLPAERLRPIEQRAVEQGGELVVVPADADGHDRLEDEGGVGAVLRYPIA